MSVSAALFGGTLFFLKEELVHDRCGASCDEGAILTVDRPAAGLFSETAATAGNVLVGINLALPHVLGAIDWLTGHHPDGGSGFATDTLILAETLAVSMLVHQVMSFATQRPRPFVYGDAVDPERRDGANAYLSFYSGHTANSFAMATGYSLIYGWRHPDDPSLGAVWALTHGLAGLDGYLRILAGYHFPTDVLAGAVVGSGIGLLIPWLHTSAVPATGSTSTTAAQDHASDRGTAPRSLRWLVLPLVADRTYGLTLAVR